MPKGVVVTIAACCVGMSLVAIPARCATSGFSLNEARQARDRADVASLQSMIHEATAVTAHNGTARDYIEIARLHEFLLEAATDRHDKPVLEPATKAGVDAARKAVALAPKSSEAHALLGSLLGQLTEYVPLGGMRYGRESTSELDEAIQLDSNNQGAYVSRALAFYFTPSMFGGSKEKASQYLHKAIQMSPNSDEAASAYIWLAQMELKQGAKSDAARDIQSALRIDPARVFAQEVEKQINGAK